MKVYQVFIQDEWDNNYFLGFYKELKEALPEINSFIEGYEGLKPITEEDLKEYPSTFSSCFDTEIISEDESESILIRGFIFEHFEEEIKNVIN